MSMTANKKVDVVFSILATGIYRPWWWAKYKEADKQAEVRAEWLQIVPRLTAKEIRDGLRRWAEQFGVDNPPSAKAFADFLRPNHTPASRAWFAGIRAILSQG